MPKALQPPLPDHWLHILLALAQGERHGLEIMRAVHDATAGHLRLWPGKLYGSLRELHAAGWLVETDVAEPAPRGGNPRFWGITAAGRDRLRDELARLQSILALAETRDVLPKAAAGRGPGARGGRA